MGLLGGIRPQGYVHNPLKWVDAMCPVKGSNSTVTINSGKDASSGC
nr:hypothetical protein [Pectobacterium parmentieri]